MKTSKTSYRQRKQSIFHCYAWQSVEDHLPEALVLKYKEAFQVLDRENAGKISLRDLSMVIFSIGINLSEKELIEFASRVVELEYLSYIDNCLGFKEFLAIIAFVVTECVSEKEATRIFQEFDKDGNGFITTSELKDLMRRLGDEGTDEEVQEMMKVADTNGDGVVSLDEFIVVMNSVHCCEEELSGLMSFPRILIDKNNSVKVEKPERFFERTLPTIVDESIQTSTNIDQRVEDESESSKKSLNSRKISENKNSNSRKLEHLTWISESEEVSRRERFRQCSSFDCSSNSALENNLKKRRKSSITKTLKSGRDALIATARTLRRISR